MTYDWKLDAYRSWELAIRMMALAMGAVRYNTLPEMYFQESRGVIP